MTAGSADRIPRRSQATLLTPLGDERQKLLPRIVAAACEDPLKDCFPPDVDGMAWHIGIGAVDVEGPISQKQAGRSSSKEARPTHSKLSRSGTGWHQLGLRAPAQHSGHGLERPASVPQDLDRELMAGMLAGTNRRNHGFSSSPGLGQLAVSTRERGSAVGVARGAAERAAALLTAPRDDFATDSRCPSRQFVSDASEPASRLSTPGWVPPSSRGSLASRQSNSRNSRQGNSRLHAEYEAQRRRGPTGLPFAGTRQRPGRPSPAPVIGLSLPAAAFFDLESAVAPDTASRSASPDVAERRCSIDDELSIPKSIFDDFLQAGKAARHRGQHYLDKKRPGGPRLVNTAQPSCLAQQSSSKQDVRGISPFQNMRRSSPGLGAAATSSMQRVQHRS